jgi:hypothetical protein
MEGIMNVYISFTDEIKPWEIDDLSHHLTKANCFCVGAFDSGTKVVYDVSGLWDWCTFLNKDDDPTEWLQEVIQGWLDKHIPKVLCTVYSWSAFTKVFPEWGGLSTRD